MRNREQPLKVCPGSVTEVLERRFPESLKDACPASHWLSSPYWKFKNEGIQTVFGSEDSCQAVCVKKCYQQTVELFPCVFLGSQTKQVNCVIHSTVQTLGIVYYNYLHFYQMAGVFPTWRKIERPFS